MMSKPPRFPDLLNLSIAISNTTEDRILLGKARALAERLHIETVSQERQDKYDLLLVYTEKGLEIQLKQEDKGRRSVILHVDFLSSALTYRRLHGGGIKQELARAVGIKPGIRPSIIDATAGLGKDALLMASWGCPVTMIERSPLLAALLEDGLQRAQAPQGLPEPIRDRLHLLHGDAAILIRDTRTLPRPDTIYLDPMYPHGNKTALNRLEMRVIRKLVGDDGDAAELLEHALDHAKKRVAVKRPKRAPLLGGREPSHVIKMKNSRYDVYMI